MSSLAFSAGYEIHSTIFQTLRKPDAALFVGKGKANELAGIITGTGVDVVIFDDDLSPAQARNLEKLLSKGIIDRTGLILEIFARNAQTKEAKTQVELARLQYLLPRLTRQWTHLERQVGGIGVRAGMGETQLEIDRRLIRKRIKSLNEELEVIEQQRQGRRNRRQKMFNVSLVGYTNAGKSTLFNVLSNADVLVEDKLFATLDSTVRRIEMNGNRPFLLADTVGFIKKLPHSLVASFRSTLGVVRDADLLLHVVDLSRENFEEHIEAVKAVLKELKIQGIPILHVFNKVDIVENEKVISSTKQAYPNAVFVSAGRKMGIGKLLETIDNAESSSYSVRDFEIPIKNSRLVSVLYELGEVLNQEYNEETTKLTVKLSQENESKAEHVLKKAGIELG